MEYDLDAIDMDVLNEARSLLKARWPEFVEGYLEDAATYIANIKKGFSDGDIDAVSFNAHPLKSSSSGLGIAGVGDIAAAIEACAKDGVENDEDISLLEEIIPLLDDAFSRAVPKLRTTLEGAGA